MSYNKTVWVNGSVPAVNATNLNKIEKGIYDAHNDLAAAKEELEKKINALSNPVTIDFSLSPAISEVGVAVTSIAFSWTISNYSNIKNAKIYDITAQTYIHTIEASSGSVNISVNITNNTSAHRDYRLDVIDNNDVTTSNTKSLNWYFAVYSGVSTNASLNESQIESLTKSLQSGFAKTYAFGSGGYKYIAYPSSMGAINNFKDEATGLNIPFESVTVLSITNGLGVATNYNIYRSTNILNGSINIIIN